MTVAEFIKELKKHDQKSTILVASDEELNSMMSGIEVASLSDNQGYTVIYGLTGTDVEPELACNDCDNGVTTYETYEHLGETRCSWCYKVKELNQ
jgi:protein-arginine kinase activator protein McsA